MEHVERFKGQISISWLFGILRFRINLPGGSQAKTETKRKTKKKSEKKPKKPKSRTGGSNVLAVIKQRAFRRRVLRFFRDLLRAAHSHDFTFRMRLGTGDPADTGRLWAFFGPVNALAQNLRHAEISFEPEFVDPVFEFESSGRFRFIPIQFIAITVAFVVSRPSLRAWRTLRQQHAR